MRSITFLFCSALLVFSVISVSASEDVGEAVYNKSCAACHNSGVMGAPKTGDKDVWANHIADGEDHMVQNAINGIGKMPPKGGNMKLTDEEVKEAVEYMLEKSK